MTARMSIRASREQEIYFIDEGMMYNMLLRGQSMKIKNSFIIYDFSDVEISNVFNENTISIQRDFPAISSFLADSLG